jgi:hypothetical protein
VRFRYAGKTGLTVWGPVSGRKYRFNYPDVVVEIDPLDAPAIATIPCLKREMI